MILFNMGTKYHSSSHFCPHIQLFMNGYMMKGCKMAVQDQKLSTVVTWHHQSLFFSPRIRIPPDPNAGERKVYRPTFWLFATFCHFRKI